MPHVPFTLDQLATIQAFPTSHRLALRTRIVLDPEEAEEVAEMYARHPHEVVYTLAAAPGGIVEVTACWPEGVWRAYSTLAAALAGVLDLEATMERAALAGASITR